MCLRLTRWLPDVVEVSRSSTGQVKLRNSTDQQGCICRRALRWERGAYRGMAAIADAEGRAMVVAIFIVAMRFVVDGLGRIHQVDKPVRMHLQTVSTGH